MTTQCNIINPSAFSVNNSGYLYNGVIVGLTINLGFLATPSRGTITVIQDGDNPLDTPAKGDGDITIKIMEQEMMFRVSGYQLANSAGNSPTTMTINIADCSNRILDNNFIALKDVKSNNVPANVYLIGRKKGPQPNLESLPNLSIPRSHSRSVDIRAVWDWVKLKLEMRKLEGITWGTVLTKGDVDFNVLNANGKSWFYTNPDETEESIYTDDDFAAVLAALAGKDPKGKTLREVLDGFGEGLIGGAEGGEVDKLPDGKYSFEGSLRQVLNNISGETGRVMYWDVSTNKIRLPNKINTAEGLAKLQNLATKCEALSSSKSSDFTVTAAKVTAGLFTADWDTEFNSKTGGPTKRYLNAHLLNPTFHYTPCKFTNPNQPNTREVKVLDVLDADVRLAMAASYDPKVYGMYVIQSILKANANTDDIGRNQKLIDLLGKEIKNLGRQNKKTEFIVDWLEETAGGNPSYTINSLFKEFYAADVAGKELTKICTGEIYPFTVQQAGEEQLYENFITLKEDWNNPDNNKKPPFSIGGAYDPVKGYFDTGNMFIQYGKEDDLLGLRCVLGENGIDAQEDTLRKYLNVISKFYKRYYVLRDQSGIKTLRNDINGGRFGGANNQTYGFYVSSNVGRPNFEVEDGYDIIAVDPFAKILTCTTAGLSEFFVALCMMYNPKLADCPDGLAGNAKINKTTVVEFLSAVSKDKLKDFFNDPVNWMKQNGVKDARKKDFNKKEAKEDITGKTPTSPNYQMYLILRKEDDTLKNMFPSSTETCFTIEKGVQVATTPAKAVAIAEKIYELPLLGSKGTKPEDKAAITSLLAYSKLWLVTDENIEDEIFAVEFPERTPRLKIWYTIDTSIERTWNKEGRFICNASSASPADDSVWTSTFQQGIDISATDLGLSNKAFDNYFNGNALDEGNAFGISNQANVQGLLQQKVDAQSWIDDTVAISHQLKVVLHSDIEGVELPKMEEGLESFSLTINNGKIELSLSVGNSAERQAKKILMNSTTTVNQQGYPYLTNIPDGFIVGASPRIISSSKGLQL